MFLFNKVEAIFIFTHFCISSKNLEPENFACSEKLSSKEITEEQDSNEEIIDQNLILDENLSKLTLNIQNLLADTEMEREMSDWKPLRNNADIKNGFLYNNNPDIHEKKYDSISLFKKTPFEKSVYLENYKEGEEFSFRALMGDNSLQDIIINKPKENSEPKECIMDSQFQIKESHNYENDESKKIEVNPQTDKNSMGITKSMNSNDFVVVEPVKNCLQKFQIDKAVKPRYNPTYSREIEYSSCMTGRDVQVQSTPLDSETGADFAGLSKILNNTSENTPLDRINSFYENDYSSKYQIFHLNQAPMYKDNEKISVHALQEFSEIKCSSELLYSNSNTVFPINKIEKPNINIHSFFGINEKPTMPIEIYNDPSCCVENNELFKKPSGIGTDYRKMSVADHWTSDQFIFDTEIYGLRNYDGELPIPCKQSEISSGKKYLLLHNNAHTNFFAVYLKISLSAILDQIIYQKLIFDYISKKSKLIFLDNSLTCYVNSVLEEKGQNILEKSEKTILYLFYFLLSRIFTHYSFEHIIILDISDFLRHRNETKFLKKNIGFNKENNTITFIFDDYPSKFEMISELSWFFLCFATKDIKFYFLLHHFVFYTSQLQSTFEKNYMSSHDYIYSQKIQFKFLKRFFEEEICPDNIISKLSIFKNKNPIKIILCVNLVHEFIFRNLKLEKRSISELLIFIIKDIYYTYKNLESYAEKYENKTTFMGHKKDFYIIHGHAHIFHREIVSFMIYFKKQLDRMPFEISKDFEDLFLQFFLTSYKILMHFQNCRLIEQTINIPNNIHKYDSNPTLSLYFYGKSLKKLIKRILGYYCKFNGYSSYANFRMKKIDIEFEKCSQVKFNEKNKEQLWRPIILLGGFLKFFLHDVLKEGMYTNKLKTPYEHNSLISANKNKNQDVINPKFKYYIIFNYLEGEIFDYDEHYHRLLNPV